MFAIIRNLFTCLWRRAFPGFLLLCTLAVTALIIGNGQVQAVDAAADEPFKIGWSSKEADDSTDSVAWGDFDNDGDLDQAVGNYGEPNRVYRNDGMAGGVPQLTIVWSADVSDSTTSVAWGDVDNDGDLDLAVGNYNQPNRLYRNNSGVLSASAVWSDLNGSDHTNSVAWGDVDGDGDIDLAVGNTGGINRLYQNTGTTLTTTAVWNTEALDYLTNSVAWGDFDGDGDLDLATGSECISSYPNCREVRVYRNDNGSLNTTSVWSSTGSGNVQALAWGDYDGDGDLDLGVGGGTTARIFRNDNGYMTPNPVWTSSDPVEPLAIAWGDYDSDGDLDLAVGSIRYPNRLYRNDGSMQSTSAIWSTDFVDRTAGMAFGDYDGDGNLDLAIANWGQPNRLYHNEGSSFTAAAAWFSAAPADWTMGLAWGDVDGDGDLDLAVGNYTQPNRLYKNDGGMLAATAAWSADASNHTYRIYWGDVDRDGDLDLLASNWALPTQLYRNNAGTLTTTPVWSSVESNNSAALGDYDNDGYLDLAAGASEEPIRLYHNNSGTLSTTASWQSASIEIPSSLAWGDYDNDGDLDLAVGNGCGGDPYTCWSNRIYRNDRGVLTPTPVWSSAEGDDTRSIRWGDYDGDGFLDLGVSNRGTYGQLGRVYHNEGGVMNPNSVWSSLEANWSYSADWNDYDSDGDVDFTIGNWRRATLQYQNNGGVLTSSAAWATTEVIDTQEIAWGDMDGDGRQDLAAGVESGLSRVYLNNRGVSQVIGSIPTVRITRSGPEANYYAVAQISSGIIPIYYRINDPQGDPVKFIRAWYSLNGGGQWFPAVAASGTITTNLSTVSSSTHTYSRTANLAIPSPGIITSTLRVPLNETIMDVNVVVNATHTFDWDLIFKLKSPSNQTVTLISQRGLDGDNFTNTTLDDEASVPISSGAAPFNGRYSPEQVLSRFDGYPAKGDWKLSVQDVYDLDSGTLISWDLMITTNSGRQYTYSWDVNKSGLFGQSDNVVFRIQAVPAVTNRSNQTPGPYLFGAFASQSYPFRVRGTQVRVINGSLGAPNALVYRLESGLGGAAEAISDASGQPFRTDSQGYLQGRGEIKPGDKLVALLPISSGSGYTLYYTNATPVASGLTMYTVPTGGGVQTLTVSSTHPLLLFNLDVSLEWDARQDAQYLQQLRFDFQRASELLYDWTNGQAALGTITVYHDRQHWGDAHIRIYASNHRRPVAILGGIVATAVNDPSIPALLYRPGMVHMGSVWNRYGDPGSALGEDWPRALAHELGHYTLYQDDDYLGLDPANHLVGVTSCAGTAMADPYRDDYSELKRQGEWSPGCDSTLAEKTTGRADWDTVTAFYPTLSGAALNSGPSWLPLAVTRMVEVSPVIQPQTLEDPRFYLKDAGGASLQPSNGRAFLFRGNVLIDLGSPAVDQVLARGATPGDKLCVMEAEKQRIGCKTVAEGDNQQLTLNVRTDWQPEILVTPVTTRTINLKVGNLPEGLALSARLYAGDGTASNIIGLVRMGSDYLGTFNLASPATEGHVRVWSPADSQKEGVVDFALGGNPAGMRSGFAGMRSGFAGMRSGFAPSTSADGQVILYTTSLTFPDGQFYTLQAASRLPTPPVWLTPVGQAYWLQKSAGAPNLSGTSLAMGYLLRDVPQEDERWIKIYRWTTKDGWQALSTVVDENVHNAIAVIPGEGLYALFSSVEIQLFGPGWDLFAYPVNPQPPLTVAVALQSISGKYTTVYWFNGEDGTDPWKVYGVGVPGWVNDLLTLQYGEAYWINLTEAVILRLRTGANAPEQASEGYPAPPATYYGSVGAGQGFEPQAGMMVSAWVNGVQCGQGMTQSQGGQVVYTLNVSADGLNTPACGVPGSTVTFRVGGVTMFTTTLWSNDRVWELNLSAPKARVFLPDLLK